MTIYGNAIIGHTILDIMQVSKHRRTVCTHQIRDCDFKDSGCQFKVSSFIDILGILRVLVTLYHIVCP